MGKRKPKQSRRPQQALRAANVKSKNPFWRRPALWLGGLVTAVATGVLVNFLTTQAQLIDRPSPRVAAGPPLKVLSEESLFLDQNVVWAFPHEYLPNRDQLNHISSLIESSTPASRSAFVRWFSSRQAYEVGGANTQLVIQNSRDYSIRIIDMNVVKSCQRPLVGTLFFGAGGAEDATVGIGFNLDSSNTDAETARGIGWEDWIPGYFTNYTISLKPGEQQVFDVYTATTYQACTYRLQVTILDGERKVYQFIGDGDQPFRVTAMPGGKSAPIFSDYRFMYLGGAASPHNGAFIRVNPTDPFGFK